MCKIVKRKLDTKESWIFTKTFNEITVRKNIVMKKRRMMAFRPHNSRRVRAKAAEPVMRMVSGTATPTRAIEIRNALPIPVAENTW